MAGRKRSSCFIVTINHVEWTKDCVGEFFCATGDIARLAVGEEPHNPPLDSNTGEAPEPDGFHHHIFIEFKTKYYLPEVREMFEEFLGHEPVSIDIQVSNS